MMPCTRVGIDTTWKCSGHCKHCFYLRSPKLHAGDDVPIDEVKKKISTAQEGGLDHVVFVGYGEPSLAGTTEELIEYSHGLGMATSMITSGVTNLRQYIDYYEQGMDHLHISSHGLRGTLDDIMGIHDAFRKQSLLKDWMTAHSWPFRTNVTLQQANYRELPELAEYEISKGVYHFVFLGFLPHYEWGDHLTDVAVHPTELRPYIEEAACRLLEAKTHFTIRYHPLCQLDEKLWPYVVNARFVAYDPAEWNYSLQVYDLESLWRDSVACGESTACQEPCRECIAYPHCGGWNQKMANAFPGCLEPIREVPGTYVDIWEQRGGLHDLNPFNQLSCTLRVTHENYPDYSNTFTRYAAKVLNELHRNPSQ